MTSFEFGEKFLNVFAKDFTQKQLKQKHIGTKSNQLLWNIFAYVPCYEGDRAREEYDSVSKDGAFEIFYYDGEDCEEKTSPLSNELSTAKGVDDSDLVEFYIIGKDFSWCYVVTHAGDHAGPYFCYAQK